MGIGVLLFSWHQAHYRFGLPDLECLERLLFRESKALTELRSRSILEVSNLGDRENKNIKPLFDAMLDALKIASGKCKGRKSPVAAAKALHLLAPQLFPIWDEKIAKAYRTHYGSDPFQAYVNFFHVSKEMVGVLLPAMNGFLDGKTPLKVLDEYNYARFTKDWN